MENEITASLARKSSPSSFTPGPESARGQLVIVQRLVAGGQQEAGEREAGLKWVPNKMCKAGFEIRLPSGNKKQRGNPSITRQGCRPGPLILFMEKSSLMNVLVMDTG